MSKNFHEGQGYFLGGGFGFELSAASGDVDAAALAEGAWEAGVAEDLLELEGVLVGGGGAGEAVGGVEWDEVDVGVDALEELCEGVSLLGCVVLSVDEGPAEEDAFLGGLGVGAAGLDEVVEGVAVGDGDECGALLFGGAVEGDGEAEGLIFLGEAEDLGDEADGGDGDV